MKFSTVLTIIFFFEVLIIGDFIAEEMLDRTIVSLIKTSVEDAAVIAQSKISQLIQGFEVQLNAVRNTYWSILS